MQHYPFNDQRLKEAIGNVKYLPTDPFNITNYEHIGGHEKKTIAQEDDLGITKVDEDNWIG